MAGRRMVNRWDMVPAGAGIQDILDYCHQRGLDPDAIKFSGTVHFKWQSPETDQERERRLEHESRSQKKQEEWERRKYKELWNRYGGKAPEET